MIVFDASGSMSGNGWGYGSETAGVVSRIDKVRATLAKILPSVTRFRRVGLITYGPGVWNQCNVKLNLPQQAWPDRPRYGWRGDLRGSPCALGTELSRDAVQLTVHVIGLRVKGYTWTGEQSVVETKCLAERNRGLYLTVETEDELMQALEKTLGCPAVTQLQAKERASRPRLR